MIRGKEGLLYENLLEASVDGIFLLNDDCKVFGWNKSMQGITGISRECAMGQPVFDLSPVFKKEAFIEGLKRALNNEGVTIQKRFSFINESGRGEYNMSLSPFSLPDGSGLGCMVNLRELESYSNESRFKPLVEESPVATAIFDKNGNAKYFNKAYGRIWGVGLREVYQVVKSYNILEDKQLRDLGVMPFVEKAFDGATVEIPTIAFNPYNSPAMRDIGIDAVRYVKGHLFPIVSDKGALEEVVVSLNDITFQKQAEQILEEAQLRFQRLTHGLPGVIYECLITDQGEQQFTYISDGCMEMFGIHPDDILKDSTLPQRCIHPDDLESYLESQRMGDIGAQVWEWTGRIVVNGNIRWIEGKSRPEVLADGTIVRYGLLLDITDKKKAEDNYLKSEERLKIAIQGVDLGLWEWDNKKGKFLHNSGWAERLGYSYHHFAELLQTPEKLIHPDDLPGYLDHMCQLENSETDMVEFEYRMATNDHDWLWVLEKGRITERNGKSLKASGTLLDIHKSKVTQNLIQQNEQLFTQLFEGSPMGVVLLNEEHCVVQMNKGFEDIFGYTKEDIIGNQLNNIIVPESQFKEAMDINTLTASGSVGVLESKRLHKDGSLVPVIIYGVPVSLNEKTIGIYGIYVNIRERVEAERELQIRNAELDNFVYKVSHDLRAPLSSVLGLVHLASHEQNDDDIREYIGIIENRIHQLDSFINDVLSHSKNLKMEITTEQVDFREIIENCYQELSYLPNSMNILRKMDIADEPFYSDLWRIKEVFRNLISNSIKYSDPEKSCSFVSIDISITPQQATIRIEDNGIGVDTSSQEKVFDMFYRATSKAEGSGIGLYIVRNAIEKLHGSIAIESKDGEGTIFNIILPNRLENAMN